MSGMDLESFFCLFVFVLLVGLEDGESWRLWQIQIRQWLVLPVKGVLTHWWKVSSIFFLIRCQPMLTSSIPVQSYELKVNNRWYGCMDAFFSDFQGKHISCQQSGCGIDKAREIGLVLFKITSMLTLHVRRGKKGKPMRDTSCPQPQLVASGFEVSCFCYSFPFSAFLWQ